MFLANQSCVKVLRVEVRMLVTAGFIGPRSGTMKGEVGERLHPIGYGKRYVLSTANIRSGFLLINLCYLN